MGQIVGPETLDFNLNQTPDNYPKDDHLIQHSCLEESRKIYFILPAFLGSPLATSSQLV